jgi:hypothetical protein
MVESTTALARVELEAYVEWQGAAGGPGEHSHVLENLELAGKERQTVRAAARRRRGEICAQLTPRRRVPHQQVGPRRSDGHDLIDRPEVENEAAQLGEAGEDVGAQLWALEALERRTEAQWLPFAKSTITLRFWSTAARSTNITGSPCPYSRASRAMVRLVVGRPPLPNGRVTNRRLAAGRNPVANAALLGPATDTAPATPATASRSRRVSLLGRSPIVGPVASVSAILRRAKRGDHRSP